MRRGGEGICACKARRGVLLVLKITVQLTHSLLTVGIPVVLEHGVKVFTAYLKDGLVHVDRFVLHHDREIAGLLVVKREAKTVRHRRALLTAHTDRPPHHAGVRATGKHLM